MNLTLPCHSVYLVGALSLPFWVIALGGFAAITGKCNDQDGFSTSDCGYNHGLKWFSLILELVVVLLTVGVVVLNFTERLRLVLVSYITIATMLFIVHADELVKVVYFQEHVLKNADAYEAYGAAAAGAVLLAMFNFLLILYVSVIDDTSAVSGTIQTRQVDLEVVPPVAPPVAKTNKTIEEPRAAGAPSPVTAETNV